MSDVSWVKLCFSSKQLGNAKSWQTRSNVVFHQIEEDIHEERLDFGLISQDSPLFQSFPFLARCLLFPSSEFGCFFWTLSSETISHLLCEHWMTLIFSVHEWQIGSAPAILCEKESWTNSNYNFLKLLMILRWCTPVSMEQLYDQDLMECTQSYITMHIHTATRISPVVPNF